MKNTLYFIMKSMLFGMLVLLVASVTTNAASLWSDQARSLYTVNRQWKAGDLVTVLIVEQAQATQTAGTETKKQSGVEVGVDIPIQVLQQLGGVDVDISGGDSLKSAGKTVRGGSLRARLTARVIEVLANGNLQIEGRQTIVLNGETQEIVLSGVIRSHDIDLDNTVLSSYISDARITYKGAGTLATKQQQGVLTRFFHWLF